MKNTLIGHHNRGQYTNYLLLLLICLLAYWPITFGVFSVKNDAIHYFLPYRFNISEAIRNGEMPYWSPYIYLGNPVYGDMQSGAWNPIVWLFSLLGRYDITLFHFENLLYIFLGGAGMYKLTFGLAGHSRTAFLVAVSYMLSGFMLGGQLVNWLAAAAFFPFVIHYYLQTVQQHSLWSGVKTGVFLFLLLTAGYPSFFIITVYILFAIFGIAMRDRLKAGNSNPLPWKRFLLNHALVIFVFTGLALPAIISYLNLLPYYNRGTGTSYQDSLSNSFEWRHLLTLFFPTAIKASNLVSATDITCRNVYAGIFPLIILAIFPPSLNRRNILLMLLALFSLLFSLGDATPVRKICYQFIPGMDTFRHPSQMRLFFIFSLLLLAAPGLKLLFEKDTASRKARFLTTGLLTAVGIIAVTSFFMSGFLHRAGQFSFSSVTASIKTLLENITLADTIFIGALLQLVFLFLFLWWLKKEKKNWAVFSILWITNLFIMAQLVLPTSFVSKTPPGEINRLIHASPKGFPVEGLTNSLDSNSRDALAHFDKIALSYFYNKKIGISRVAYSPSFLQEQEGFLISERLYNYVSSKPVAYMADSVMQTSDSALLALGTCTYAVTDQPLVVADSCSGSNSAFVKKLSSNRFEIEAQAVSACMLVLTQSYHDCWKASLDDKDVPVYKMNTAFMGVLVPPGHHQVVFRFIPANTIRVLWSIPVTLVLLLAAAAVSLFRTKKTAQ